MPWVTNAHTHYLHSFFSEGLFSFCKNEPVKMNEWMGVHLMMLCVCACGVLGEGVEDVAFIDLLLQLQNISHYCHLWGLQFLSTWAPADSAEQMSSCFSQRFWLPYLCLKFYRHSLLYAFHLTNCFWNISFTDRPFQFFLSFQLLPFY